MSARSAPAPTGWRDGLCAHGTLPTLTSGGGRGADPLAWRKGILFGLDKDSCVLAGDEAGSKQTMPCPGGFVIAESEFCRMAECRARQPVPISFSTALPLVQS
jgi:hypothetical protein